MAHEDQGKRPGQTSGAGQQVASLVSRAKAGDRLAFERLVQQFQEAIFRMVYYRTRSRMDAEDLTQEIFMKALENLSKLRNLERFRSWLFSIAVNRVRDFHRKKRVLAIFKNQADDNETDAPHMATQADQGALEQVAKQEFWQGVKVLAKQLSRWEREVFFLRFMDHLGIREIAEVLNKSESAVKTHLYRALKKLKQNAMFVQFLEG